MIFFKRHLEEEVEEADLERKKSKDVLQEALDGTNKKIQEMSGLVLSVVHKDGSNG